MQSLKNFLFTKRFYYLLLAIPLFFIAVFDIYFAFNGNDLALRFLPTVVSILFTLTFLGIFFDLREARQWRNVEKQVMKKLRGELQLTFFLLKRFIDLSEIGVTQELSSRKSTEEELKDLSHLSLDKVTKKSEEAVEAGKQNLADYEFHLSNEGIQLLYEGKYNGQFELRRQFLNDIEAKYAKFLNPELVSCILEIQNGLQNISINANAFTEIKSDKSQVFLERFFSTETARYMHNVIVETEKIADSIGFYPY
jgi:hypothetical protein